MNETTIKQCKAKMRRRVTVNYTPGSGRGLDATLGRLIEAGMSRKEIDELTLLGATLVEQGAVVPEQ